MPSILPRLQRAGLRKGVVQGNSTWLAIGVSTWGLRKITRMAQRRTEILVREELKPGERLIIANGRATIEQAQSQGVEVKAPEAKVSESRKERKQSKKQAKQSA